MLNVLHDCIQLCVVKVGECTSLHVCFIMSVHTISGGTEMYGWCLYVCVHACRERKFFILGSVYSSGDYKGMASHC